VSQENVDLVRRLFDAVAERDGATVLSIYHPEIEWDGSRHRWSEMLPGQAIWHGHDELRRFSRRYYEMWEDLQNEIEEVIDAGEHVIAVVNSRARGRASGVEVEWAHHGSVWTIRDGKVVRVVWFPDRAEALESLGLEG
jgi:ketosteroid isomerase-like protein